MQDAIQSQKKIEESLYNFGHDHTGGKNARLWPKIIYLKRKGLFLRTKPSHFGEARGGRKGVSHLVRVPCVYGTHQECHNRPTLPACVCEGKGCCLMVDWMLSAFLFWSGNDENKTMCCWSETLRFRLGVGFMLLFWQLGHSSQVLEKTVSSAKYFSGK